MKSALSFLSLLILMAGCRTGTIPDPNEPAMSNVPNGDALSRNIRDLMELLDDRQSRGEITADKRNILQKKVITDLLNRVDVANIRPAQAWQFGDAYRLAGDWAKARDLYAVAVKASKTEDRRINDSLRLARAQANLGESEAAVSTCRTTFDSQPQDKAPILLAVLYEIVQEGYEKSKSEIWATILEQAIEQHKQVIVDPGSKGGRAFLLARPAHIRNAWIKVAKIYQDLNMAERAREAVKNAEADSSNSGAF